MTREHASRRERLLTAGSMAAVGAVALALSAAHLDRRPLWMDEALDVQWSALPWNAYLDLARATEMSQGLFLVVLKLWLGLAGNTEWVARLPSVAFGVAAAALLVPLGTRLLDSRLAGFGAGLLLACNALGVAWSQQVRTYSLAILAAVIVTYLFVQACESGTWGWWLTYGVVAGLSVYAHFFVALVLVAHYPALIAHGRTSSVKRWAVSVGIGLLIAAPALDFALNHDYGQAGWVPPLSWPVVDETVELLSGENGVLLGLAAVGVVLLCHRAARMGSESWKLVLVAAWVAVPLVLTLALSLFKPLFTDRYLVVVIPAFCLSAAFVVRLGGKVIAVVALALTLVFALGGVRHWYTRPIEQDWRVAAQLVERNASPGQSIVVLPDWLEPVAGYYLTKPPETTLGDGTTWILSPTDRRAEVEELASEAGRPIEARIDLPGVDVHRIAARSQG